MGILCIISGSILVGLSADSDDGGLNGIGIIGYGIWIGAYVRHLLPPSPAMLFSVIR